MEKGQAGMDEGWQARMEMGREELRLGTQAERGGETRMEGGMGRRDRAG